MNVFIGPYTRWIGPYQIADLLQHVGVSKDRCHDIGHWLAGGDDKNSWLLKICNWIDGKKTRDIRVNIDSYDTWSMDSTLAIIVLPMLKQLKKSKHGSPVTMTGFQQTSNSAQFCFDFYADGDAAAEEHGHAQWSAIMDEMIWTFEQLQPDYDWEDQYWKVYPELDLSKRDEEKDSLTTPVRWKVEGECDWEGRQKHSDRIQNGLELFGRYYNNLWD